MVVTAVSGSGGFLDFFLFSSAASGSWELRWRAPRNFDGYHGSLDLGSDPRDIITSSSIPRGGNPNCCPTGRTAHLRWRWVANGFRIIERWKDLRLGWGVVAGENPACSSDSNCNPPYKCVKGDCFFEAFLCPADGECGKGLACQKQGVCLPVSGSGAED